MTAGALGHISASSSGRGRTTRPRRPRCHSERQVLSRTRRAVLILPDSSGMWEDNDVEDEGDGEDEDEDEGLAGQLLSDLIASSKYGTVRGHFPGVGSQSARLFCSDHSSLCCRLTDDDYYEDDEEDDPDALKDPIYQVDLQVRHPVMMKTTCVSNIIYILGSHKLTHQLDEFITPLVNVLKMSAN